MAREIRYLVTAGCAVTLTTHAREEMEADAVSLVDVMHVLRSGVVQRAPDLDVRTGHWKVRVEGTSDECHLCVVVVVEVVAVRVVTVGGQTAMTRACEHCGGRVRHRVIREFRDDALLGLPGVVLVNAVTEAVCTRCRQVAGITIPNLAGAIAAAGIARVMDPVKLTGAEFRAVRRAAGYTAKDLAEVVLDVRAETVSRWETGAEPIGPPTRNLLASCSATPSTSARRRSSRSTPPP